MLLQTVVEVVY